jgi:mono/diheme cytochrome c family protein
MTQKPVSVALVVLLVVTIWIISRPLPAFSGDASKGRPLYEKYCLMCHGPEGRGDGPVGLHANPPAANFHAPESKNRSDAALLKIIQDGHTETAMAGWKNALSEEHIKDILAYIRKLSPPTQGPTDRG